MKQKIVYVAWILILLLMSFPTGYFVQFVDNARMVRSEYLMNFIIGGIACIIVLGGISVIVYAILRKRNGNALKTALIVYSVLIGGMFVAYSFKMPAAIKQRDRHEFLSGLKETMYKVWTEEVNKMPNAPPELKNHVEEICTCIYSSLESNEALVDEFIADKDPLTFPSRSPQMKKICQDCVGLYMK